MKRNKIVALAVVVMMMVGAVVLMSCAGCPGNGDCTYDPETLSYDYCAITASGEGDPEKSAQCAVDILVGKDCTC